MESQSNSESEIKNLYHHLCKYKFFDYFNINYKIGNYDKTTKWYFYDDEGNFNYLRFDQITIKKVLNKNMYDVFERLWYINKESNNYITENIPNIKEYINEIEHYLIKMNDYYTQNHITIHKINELIGRHMYKDTKNIIWNLGSNKKNIEYIKIYINVFKNNNEDNIKIVTKSKNKNETDTYYNVSDFIVYLNNNLKDLYNKKDTLNENELTSKIENLSIENTNTNQEFPNLYIVRPRNEVANTYKNLFIRHKLEKRIIIQSCKYKYEYEKQQNTFI
jgi:hypothetical protein